MSDREHFDVKRCAKCAAWIPTTATKCSYCDTSSPDEPLARRPGSVLSLRHGVRVTDVLIAVNLAFFVYSISVARFRGIPGNPLQWTLTGTGFGRGVLLAGGNFLPSLEAGEWWRLVSANFLHFGLWHIALNMYALRDLGRLAERLFGPARFLTIYLVSGLGCTAAMAWWSGRSPEQMGLGAGASGAICGLLGVLFVFLMRAGTARGREIATSLGRSGLITLGLGFFLPAGSTVGHLGGALVGAAFGFFLHESFATRLSPQLARKWRSVAVALVAIAAVALAFAVRHAFTYTGEI